MKKIIVVMLMTCLVLTVSRTADKSNSRANGLAKTTVQWAKHKKQTSGDFSVWLSNQMIMGIQAWDGSPPGDDCNPQVGLGCVYPATACVEHLYGAGPWIAGIKDGVRYVTEGYNGTNGVGYFLPNQSDTARDQMWSTAEGDTFFDVNTFGYYKTPMNKRNVDDDNDGKTDEDELDGFDNDHDWVRATDDLGADGLPDSMEVGCKGPYDPVTNPDPAFDNYDPNSKDICHPDASGRFPLKKDPNIYTQNNGIPDHGEPHVDEDYAAVSDHDIYCAATDTFRTPSLAGHKPMGVKVWQKSYAWDEAFAQSIIFFEYSFVNVGKKSFNDVYVGFFADMDVGPVNQSGYPTRNYAAYLDSIRTAYIHNPVDRGSTPLGVTVLATPRPLDQLRYTFQWHDFSAPCGATDDSDLYSCMSCEAFGYTNCIKPDEPQTQLQDTRFIFSFGPFFSADSTTYGIPGRPFQPGDTLKIAIALVTGDAVSTGANNLVDNARNALQLYKNGYARPPVPPSPCLDTTVGFKKVTLRWGKLFTKCTDPTSVWDDSNRIADAFPDTSWRKINPPNPGESGGRYFEGYRLYRSTDITGDKKTFTLLKQFDELGDDFEYNTGIETTFVDSNLFRGNTYWYSVTSFGIPNLTVVDRPGPGGVGVVHDSLFTAAGESDIDNNKIRVTLPFSSSDQLGQVLVVPNPYRVDNDYTQENGGWEGPRSKWTENNRLLKFIHLPRKCTIRVFTLTGDLVSTLYHDVTGAGDEDRGELDWNILSESNRALASGIYVYTVESPFGRQIGKFVLIR